MNEEAANQKILFNWAFNLENMHPELALMFHIPNEGKRSKATGAELKRAGLKSGVPDVILPVARSGFHGLAIEMKAGRNAPTKNQKEWLQRLSAEGWRCFVCWGFEAAAKVISDYIGFQVQFMREPQKIREWGPEGPLD